MGAALEWRIAEVGALRYADAVPTAGSAAGIVAGAGWLLAAVLFVVAGALLIAHRAIWRTFALIGVVASVVVIGLHPAPAVAGLVVDGLVLILIVAMWIKPRGMVR